MVSTRVCGTLSSGSNPGSHTIHHERDPYEVLSSSGAFLFEIKFLYYAKFYVMI